ncbi:hypothetical protein B0J13DRAFT_637305 [Dactylonectria estremocensis]|uniref:Uncharacterized protein n=1 Tax=Dactylonectria estremocensis TaxID=1079267 RepID=A0A9P9EQU0_9HYPO|nr:hypothetical protein B0J13DRAFT_637305 [Dactylonectria estremocensis]
MALRQGGDIQVSPQHRVTQLPWSHDIREFPFISTCLMLGLTSDHVYRTRPHDVQAQPLATTFRDDQPEYGMVILDISDRDDIGHGIVSFPFHYMGETQPNYWGEYDPIEDGPPSREPDVDLDESRPDCLYRPSSIQSTFRTRAMGRN